MSVLPIDIEPRRLQLPSGPRRSAVLFTGAPRELRYRRFALRIQQEFPGLVRAWFAQEGVGTTKRMAHFRRPALELARALGTLDPGRLRRGVASLAAEWQEARRLSEQRRLEQELFAAEVEELELRVHGVKPRTVTNPNAGPVLARLREIDPYLILVLGGGLLGHGVLSCARGLAINQHAGWSPDLKGSRTIEAALYHRRIDLVGSTVHIMTTAADAGPILRRSRAYLPDDAGPAECFLRTVALGTELMVEVVHEALARDFVTVFDQPRGGRTLRHQEMQGFPWRAVQRDHRSGLLARMIQAERSY